MLFKVNHKWNGPNINMSFIFQNLTLKAFSAQIDRRASSGKSKVNGTAKEAEDFAADAKALLKSPPASFPSADLNITSSTPLTVLLTGATGFLGAYLLRDLLTRTSPQIKVIAHIRALDTAIAFKRIIQPC
jgi:L-aminoadipate-semialdehyde dehydrogenase